MCLIGNCLTYFFISSREYMKKTAKRSLNYVNGGKNGPLVERLLILRLSFRRSHFFLPVVREDEEVFELVEITP